MKIEVDVVFFDLFYTLVIPEYNKFENEYDVLGISKEEWEKYAEDELLYRERAIGNVQSPIEIINGIVKKMNLKITQRDLNHILSLRKERFKQALLNIDQTIINVLKDLKEKGKKLCLISNADIIDVMFWKVSPLYSLFDEAIFSYKVGCLKPNAEIYQLALYEMNVTPEKSVFIGDGGSNELKGAKAANIKTILTEYLVKRDDSTLMEYTDYYVKDFIEIKSILR